MRLPVVILGTTLFIVGSNANAITLAEGQPKKIETVFNQEDLQRNDPVKHTTSEDRVLSPEEAQKVIAERSKEVITAIKNKDMEKLKWFVHPEKGVRFTPQAIVKKSDLVFTPKQVEKLATDNTVYNWGVEHILEGNHEKPIKLTFNQYYNRYIYDRDFANAEKIGYNKRISEERSNIREVYPNSIFVEYYVSGMQQHAYLDWKSLTLVYEKKDNQWYLVGIVHIVSTHV